MLGNCFTDLSKFLNERLLSKFLKAFETEHAVAMIEFYSYRLTQHFYTHNMPPSQLKLDDQSWYWPCERFYYTTRSLIAILLLSVIIGIGNLVTVENRLVFRRVGTFSITKEIFLKSILQKPFLRPSLETLSLKYG
jgi:hypothetical protein